MNKTKFVLINIFLLSILAFCPRPYFYDINKGVKYLNENASKKSKGLCAQYVRQALEAGGCSTWGHPMCAKDYSNFLPYLDFSEVSKKDYTPQKGDIIVFDAVKGHPFGHIAMWNGKQWVSDFKQKNKFVARFYRLSGTYKYYRMEKKEPWRRFTLRQHINGCAVQPIVMTAEKVFHSALNRLKYSKVNKILAYQ